LAQNFALGDFVCDALRGRPIAIKGDGTPYRSYIYITDLLAWLWTVLVRGESGRPYNIGSDEAFTIRQIAEMVRDVSGASLPITVAQPPNENATAERYVPDVTRAKKELDLSLTISLPQAIGKMLSFYRAAPWDECDIACERVDHESL